MRRCASSGCSLANANGVLSSVPNAVRSLSQPGQSAAVQNQPIRPCRLTGEVPRFGEYWRRRERIRASQGKAGPKVRDKMPIKYGHFTRTIAGGETLPTRRLEQRWEPGTNPLHFDFSPNSIRPELGLDLRSSDHLFRGEKFGLAAAISSRVARPSASSLARRSAVTASPCSWARFYIPELAQQRSIVSLEPTLLCAGGWFGRGGPDWLPR